MRRVRPIPVDIVMGVEESQGLADGVIRNHGHVQHVVGKECSKKFP